jgi:multisubunit Na+/H+ antiporter MnhC subunit
MSLLAPLAVARRITALVAFFALIALVLTLLWRVYVHHDQADPYDREEAVTVQLDVLGTAFGRT